MISNKKLSKAATKKMITQCVTIKIQCQKWQLSGFKTILNMYYVLYIKYAMHHML